MRALEDSSFDCRTPLGLVEVLFALRKRRCFGFDRLTDSAELFFALFDRATVGLDLSFGSISFTDAGRLRDLLASTLQPFVPFLELGALLHLELFCFGELLALLSKHGLQRLHALP